MAIKEYIKNGLLKNNLREYYPSGNDHWQLTVTWKYLTAYPDTWTTVTETYNYDAKPSRSNPSTVTSGNERKVFKGTWSDGTTSYTTANLPCVTANVTYIAQYKKIFFKLI